MKYTKEVLEPLVRDVVSFAELARVLGIAPIGSNTTNLARQCKRQGVDTSHFTGQAHQRGKQARNRLLPEDVFVLRTPEQGRSDTRLLIRALLESGVEYKCEVCGMGPEWMGKPLKFQIDHKDGQFWNNTKSNLRFICPNCHVQTDSWGSKNKGT